MKNVACHSFTQMKGDYTTNSHYLTCTDFAWKGSENVLFELRSERVKTPCDVALLSRSSPSLIRNSATRNHGRTDQYGCDEMFRFPPMANQFELHTYENTSFRRYRRPAPAIRQSLTGRPEPGVYCKVCDKEFSSPCALKVSMMTDGWEKGWALFQTQPTLE